MSQLKYQEQGYKRKKKKHFMVTEMEIFLQKEAIIAWNLSLVKSHLIF